MSKDLQVGNDNGLPVALAVRSDGDPGPAAALAAAASALATAEAAGLHPAIDPGPELDDLERRAWRAYLHKHALVARLLEADLMARSNLPLAEFDVLFQIAMTDGQRLRMNELADRVLLSRAGITRLVDRLVEDGLVERVKCASDARGAFAALTDHGRARLEEARPGHLAAVKRYFLGSFSRAELEVLAELMGRGVPLD
jgi:DNA-binding MarR family transcriptional regulator